jgi:hypothetical protein
MTVTSEPDSPEGPPADRGVFGNLPSERPGVRSPRRSGEKQASGGKAKQPKATAAKQPAARPKPPPGPRPQPPPGDSASGPAPAPSEEPDSGRGIEDVAWAGVTVAAEAATLGVRLFSRALEAVRERR